MPRIKKRNPDARNQKVTICLNDYELELIDNLSLELDTTKADVVRAAIRAYAVLVKVNGKIVKVD